MAVTQPLVLGGVASHGVTHVAITVQRIATVAIPGRPSSVAVTPDGARLLVTSADANTVTIVDPATHAVVQILSESDGLGRDLRHIVVSPDGASAYASAYVGDSVTQFLRLQSGRFKVAGHVSTGRRPLGLAVAADGSSVLVSHYLPRGTPDDNETWRIVIQTQPLNLHHEVIWRDLGNRKEAACLGQKYGQPAEKMQLEGSATQLAGVFLPPNGELAWIPGMPDAKLDFLRCAKLDYDSESPSRKLVDLEPGAQQNDGAAIPTGMTGLSESGTSRFIAFSRG